MSNGNTEWDNDAIQFPRLLASLRATQKNIDYGALCGSIKLARSDIEELFDRAHEAWEEAKAPVRNASTAQAGGPCTDESPEELWQDEDGYWTHSQLSIGRFRSEDEARLGCVSYLVREVSDALAERTNDDAAQGWASDLNAALASLAKTAVTP
jgi:hypothetical protein